MVQTNVVQIIESLLHIAFPHICAGCGSDTMERQHMLCLQCLDNLPATGFAAYADNPVTKLFTGRLPVEQATAQYYFTKKSLMQQLLHDFKYRGNKELGYYLGELMGKDIQQSELYTTVDAIVPLPLFTAKEKQRGYNQAEIVCKGIANEWHIPVVKNAVIRKEYTESQTRKSRVQRWQNMEDRFELIDEKNIAGKHILLVDDVITTGATLEACGRAILKAKDVRLSIATLCFALD